MSTVDIKSVIGRIEMDCSAYESAIISQYSFGGYSALIRRWYTNTQMGVQMEGTDGGYKRRALSDKRALGWLRSVRSIWLNLLSICVLWFPGSSSIRSFIHSRRRRGTKRRTKRRTKPLRGARNDARGQAAWGTPHRCSTAPVKAMAPTAMTSRALAVARVTATRVFA